MSGLQFAWLLLAFTALAFAFGLTVGGALERRHSARRRRVTWEARAWKR